MKENNNFEENNNNNGFIKRKINGYLDGYFKEKFQDIEAKINDIILKLDIQEGSNNAIIDRLHQITSLESCLRDELKEHTVTSSDRLGRLEENVRNTNIIVRDLGSELSGVHEYRKDIERRVYAVEENIRNSDAHLQCLNRKLTGDYAGIDYKDFEDRFRGSREVIRERQIDYLKYFSGKKDVIDVGCGEGIFLELLKEHEIPSRGADLYKPYVDTCIKKGLDVEHMDAIEYIRKQERIDGLFAAQLVEHLSYHQIKELSDLAYRRMTDGSVMILETPNPMTLAVFTHAFYMDPTHIRPIHPYTLQYIVSKSGFSTVEILFTEKSKYPEHIPEIISSEIENLDEFNRSMKVVSETMFGSQDYAVIARK